MQFKLRDFGKLLKKTFIGWNERDPFRQSAVIAYYAIFAIPGLLVLVITLTGYFYDRDAISQNIITQVAGTMGSETAAQIEEMLNSASRPETTLWRSIIGIIVLLAGATGVFVELQKTLNFIWEVKVIPRKGIWSFFRARLFSFGLILAIAFLLLISLVISTVLAIMSEWFKADASEVMLVVFSILNFVLSLAVISFLFALMFKILPDAKIKWKYVWLGSVLTGLLFTLGKTALAFYFGKADPGSGYGAAGSIILILLWVSYSSMILFFGAEFTAQYTRLYSEGIKPTEISEKEIPCKPSEKNI